MSKDKKQYDLSEFGAEPVTQGYDLSEFGAEPVQAETPSMLETAITNIGQGLTIDNLDEILASLKSSLETKTATSSGLGGRLAGMSMDPKDQKEAIKAEKDLMKNYEKAVKEYRERFKKGEEEHPWTALGGQVAGGIIPALVSGGASAAGNVAKAATTSTKALLPAAKEAAKIGAKYGAASGLGRAEGDSLAEVAGQTVLGAGVGGVSGAVTPVLAEGAKAGGRQAKKLLESIKELIPGQESVALGYKAGRAGIKATVEDINKNTQKVSEKIQEYVYDIFKQNGLEKKTIAELAEELGVKINFLEPFEAQINKLIEAGAINPNLAKETNRYINALRQTIKPDAPQLQVIKKLEQNAAESAAKLIRKGGQVDTMTETVDKIADLIPVPEIDGHVFGLLVRGKAKGPNGEMTPFVKHWVKSFLDNPVKSRTFDPKNMSPKDAKQLIDVINDMSGDLNSSAINETQRLARQLGRELNEIYKTAIDEVGINAANKNLVQAYRILDKSGFGKKDKRLIDPRSVTDPATYRAGELRDQQIKFEKLLKDKSDSGLINRREVEESMKRLGPEGQHLVNEMKLAHDLEGIKAALGVAQGYNIEGLVGRASGVAVRGGNLAARAVNKVDALTQPIQKGVEKMSSFNNRLLQTASERLKQSDNPVSQQIADVVDQILTKDGPVRDAMIFSLSQSPTFQEVFIPEKIQQTRELLKNTNEINLNKNINKRSEQDIRTMLDAINYKGTEAEKIVADQVEDQYQGVPTISTHTQKAIDRATENSKARLNRSDAVNNILNSLQTVEGKGDTTEAAVTGNWGVTDEARKAVGMFDAWKNAKNEAARDEIDKVVASKYLNLLQLQLHKKFGKDIPQSLQEALLDTAYNMGPQTFGFKRLSKAIQKGDYLEAAKQLLDTANSGGKTLKGLAVRRAKAYNKVASDLKAPQIYKVEAKEDGTLTYEDSRGDIIFTYGEEKGKHEKSEAGTVQIQPEITNTMM